MGFLDFENGIGEFGGFAWSSLLGWGVVLLIFDDSSTIY